MGALIGVMHNSSVTDSHGKGRALMLSAGGGTTLAKIAIAMVPTVRDVIDLKETVCFLSLSKIVIAMIPTVRNVIELRQPVCLLSQATIVVATAPAT